MHDHSSQETLMFLLSPFPLTLCQTCRHGILVGYVDDDDGDDDDMSVDDKSIEL